MGFHIALQAPERVLGLIVQNANAHRTGLGPQWAGTLAYWSRPSPENEAAATAHLTFEGTRDQYLAHVLDGGHFLLETHASAATSLMLDFIARAQRKSRDAGASIVTGR